MQKLLTIYADESESLIGFCGTFLTSKKNSSKNIYMVNKGQDELGPDGNEIYLTAATEES